MSLDVEAVHLGGRTYAFVEPRDEVLARDVDHDAQVGLARAGQSTYGPCDGTTTWHARLHSPVEMSLEVEGCRDRLGALPAEATNLLTLPVPSDLGRMRNADLPSDELPAFEAAMAAAGWKTEGLTSVHGVWDGPCLPAYEGDGAITRTSVEWRAERIGTSERDCD